MPLDSYLKKQSPEVFNKNAVVKTFAIFTEKHLSWSPFFNKVILIKIY